jgi:hypothetical protein
MYLLDSYYSSPLWVTHLIDQGDLDTPVIRCGAHLREAQARGWVRQGSPTSSASGRPVVTDEGRAELERQGLR